MKTIRVFTVFFLFVTISLWAQSVEQIKNNPDKYNGDIVTTEGTVTQYVASSSSTSYYLLKGYYGGVIKVNSETKPEVNEKYKVKGIVYIDPITRRPFISEKNRTKLSSHKAEVQSQKVASQQPKQQNESQQIVNTSKGSDNTLIYVLIGAAFIILVIILVSMSNKRKKEDFSSQSSYSPSSSSSSSHGTSTESAAPPTVKMPSNDTDMPTVRMSSDDFKTIKITNVAPKTLKFIPGKLVIVSGDDKGKEFRIAGYPTSGGSVVSIGREEVKGERAYSHIQLMQRTISRKQAEIISVGGKLYIKNLSETNLTQLDGVEIQPGQKVEMKPGSRILTGEVEFQYIV